MFAKTISILLVFLIGVWLGPLNQTIAQSSQRVLIDESMPGVFVTFERSGIRKPVFQGESEKGIWLRLHNNYRFPIEVPTFDLGKGRPEVGVTYEVGSVTQNSSSKPPSGYDEEVVTMNRVASGQDLLFSIPAEHLSDSTYLRIPFRIECETRTTKGGAAPQHFAIFYGSSLPNIASPTKR